MSKPFLRMTMVLALLAAAGVAGGLSGCAAGKASIPTAEELWRDRMEQTQGG